MGGDVPELVPAVLTELGQVVLYADADGRQLSWDGAGREWLVAADYGSGYQRQKSTPEDLASEYRRLYRRLSPSSEDLARAARLAETLRAARWCARCGLGEMKHHAIYPDVWGEPELACIFLPSASIVESFGGNGEKKHWGYFGACSSVKGGLEYDGGLPYALFLHGRPMPTIQALDREWCARCTQRAWHFRNDVIAVLKDELEREPERHEIERAVSTRLSHHAEGAVIRVMLNEIRGRSKSELVDEMRREMNWRTPDGGD